MSEEYRKALAAGDFTAAGAAIMEAVQGSYGSDGKHAGIDGIHRVSRMSRAEIEADPEEDAGTTVSQTVNIVTGRVR